MRIRKAAAGVVAAVLPFLAPQTGSAADPPPPTLNLTVTNGIKTVTWGPLVPALEVLRFMSGVDLLSVSNDATGVLSKSVAGYMWRSTNNLPRQFYAVEATHLSSNALLTANILNRLAYGPTPDDVDTVAANPQAYVNQQLAPETVPNTFESYTIVQTNSAGTGLPNSNWVIVSVTGTVSAATGPFYMYPRGAGDYYLDSVELMLLFTNVTGCVTNTNTMVVTCTTNYFLGTNVLINGDFEQPLTTGWTLGTNLMASASSTDYACSGSQSCHMVANAPGSTGGNSIQQNIAAGKLTNGHRCVLRFAYLPRNNTRLLTLRLSGTGIIGSGDDDPGPPGWIYSTFTGTSTGSRFLYIYISGQGDAWVDDVKLVSGSVAGVGVNLLQNGGFESPLVSPWFAVGNHSGSTIDNTVAYSGAGSLHVVASGAGSGNGTNGASVVQTGIVVTNNGTYTISYWYRPATRNRALTVRLSGQPPDLSPDRLAGGIKRRLDDAEWGVSLDDMRRWFCQNAVGSPRQLLEVLTQFFENHFVTYHSKSRDFLDPPYNDGALEDAIATEMEYREVSRWRNALLNPNCNFYDLLKIHAESPAEIIYLDTVESRGDGARIANENYGRELFELFTMGVDNGYEQSDIVAMSRAWTGWTVRLVRREDADNPFAPAVDRNGQPAANLNLMQFGNYPGLGSSAVSNVIGSWSFVFDPAWHGTNRAPILSQWDPNSPATNPVAIGPKRYAGRLGAPWAGQSYQITIPRRTGTSAIQDGYDVIQSLANNIYTAEYLSVKLCRIFVHDDFPNPTTRVGLPEYDFYTYTNPNRTPEAELVRRCIVAWDTPASDGRKGNIRAVLSTIFNSELFRSHAGSRQKVKTPLEFVISSVRALRSVDASGNATATTDGNFSTPLSRMGSMSLFNRSDPDGYPEAGPSWISAGTLAERLRFVQSLCSDAASSVARPGDAGNTFSDPVMLIQRKLPVASQNNAGAVADYFLRLFFPGEGMANLDQYRQAAINFLDDGTIDIAAGTRLLKFNQIPVSGTTDSAYETRVRGMVSMLMTLQRFQEQ